MSCWYAIDGERLCRIMAMENRLGIDGTIRLALPRLGNVLPGKGGLFEVHADAEAGVYLAQALSWWHEPDQVLLDCTPLGESMHAGTPRDGDNFVIVAGHEPIAATGFIETRSQCQKGDHLRIELPTQLWDGLGLSLKPNGACGCMKCGCPEDPDERVWDFQQVVPPDNGGQPLLADIIMLGQRQRMQWTIDLAMRGEKTTALIGHIKARSKLSNATTANNHNT
ncbi:MAG: hypothetical protein AAGB26_03020 [Planctomycetota bacterium]